MGRAVLEWNDRLAERNRGFFRGRGLSVVNLLSSPGSGKTTLLERTWVALGERLPFAVIVGDPQTELDARRLDAAGVRATQVVTAGACHLDAEMVGRAVERMDLGGMRLLFLENVGNLVCPSAYDLGEDARVVLLSVTEGEDKPLKYASTFAVADLVLLTKVDLAGATGVDRAMLERNVRAVAPSAQVLSISAREGEGMGDWCAWLQGRIGGA